MQKVSIQNMEMLLSHVRVARPLRQSQPKEIRVEACSKCHPFYTGQRQQVVSTGGRIGRFLKKYDLENGNA